MVEGDRMKKANKAVILAMSAMMLISCNEKNSKKSSGSSAATTPAGSGGATEIIEQIEQEIVKKTFTPGCAEAVYTFSTSTIDFKAEDVSPEENNIEAEAEQFDTEITETDIEETDIEIDTEAEAEASVLMADINITAEQDGTEIINDLKSDTEYKNGDSYQINTKRLKITTEPMSYSIEFNGAELSQKLDTVIDFTELEFKKYDLENATDLQKKQTTYVMPELEATRVATVRVENSDVSVLMQVSEECGKHTLPVAEKLENKLAETLKQIQIEKDEKAAQALKEQVEREARIEHIKKMMADKEHARQANEEKIQLQIAELTQNTLEASRDAARQARIDEAERKEKARLATAEEMKKEAEDKRKAKLAEKKAEKEAKVTAEEKRILNIAKTKIAKRDYINNTLSEKAEADRIENERILRESKKAIAQKKQKAIQDKIDAEKRRLAEIDSYDPWAVTIALMNKAEYKEHLDKLAERDERREQREKIKAERLAKERKEVALQIKKLDLEEQQKERKAKEDRIAARKAKLAAAKAKLAADQKAKEDAELAIVQENVMKIITEQRRQNNEEAEKATAQMQAEIDALLKAGEEVEEETILDAESLKAQIEAEVLGENDEAGEEDNK